MKSTKRRNAVLYAVIAVVFVISLVAWFYIINATTGNTVAEIYSYGELISTIDLSDAEMSYGSSIGGRLGEHTVILSADGYIEVTKSTCINQICVNTGAIGKGSKIPIICLPHRLEIRVVSEDYNEFDAVLR